MPASSFRTLPYYALRGIIVDSAVRYYSVRDRGSDQRFGVESTGTSLALRRRGT